MFWNAFKLQAKLKVVGWLLLVAAVYVQGLQTPSVRGVFEYLLLCLCIGLSFGLLRLLISGKSSVRSDEDDQGVGNETSRLQRKNKEDLEAVEETGMLPILFFIFTLTPAEDGLFLGTLLLAKALGVSGALLFMLCAISSAAFVYVHRKGGWDLQSALQKFVFPFVFFYLSVERWGIETAVIGHFLIDTITIVGLPLVVGVSEQLERWAERLRSK